MSSPNDEPGGWPAAIGFASFEPGPAVAASDSRPRALATALYESGLALKAAGQPAAAFKALASAARDPAGPAEAALEAGRLLALARRFNEAMSWILLAARRAPKSPGPPYALGSVYTQVGQELEALRCFSAALLIDPNHVESLKSAAILQAKGGHFPEALALVERWRARAPNDADAAMLASDILVEENRYAEAFEQAKLARALKPSASTHLQVARVLTMLDRHEEALAEFLLARELDPNLAKVRVEYANCLSSLGRFDDARAELELALRLDPGDVRALAALSDIHRFTAGDPLIETMQKELAAPYRPPADKSRLHFALGKAFDDLNEPDAAMGHFRAANNLVRQSLTYDEAGTLREIARMAETFSIETVRRLMGAGARSDRPVFILGMPRSGSTLIEQILISHPDVAPGGEMNHTLQAVNAAFARTPGRDGGRFLKTLTRDDVTAIGHEYLERIAPLAKDCARLTDKQPANFLLVGLIHLALPAARIIHTVRDPIDTCLSIYTKPFDRKIPYACDLSWLGRFYKAQSALMQHWQEVLPTGVILQVRYEDVVADLEGEARRIIAHCGLDWDERCLKFYESRRAVQTASVTQVRQPIYRSSVGRSARYAPYLSPLKAALDDPAVSALFEAFQM